MNKNPKKDNDGDSRNLTKITVSQGEWKPDMSSEFLNITPKSQAEQNNK